MTSLRATLKTLRRAAPSGPVALLLLDLAEAVDPAIAHARALGFGQILALIPPGRSAPAPAADLAVAAFDSRAPRALQAAANATIAALPGRWIHTARAGEYLSFPMADHRRIGDLTDFLQSERRPGLAGCVIDVFPDRLDGPVSSAPGTACHLDRAGYTETPVSGPGGRRLDRQIRVDGGLRARYAWAVPAASRRIDRVLMVRARPGLRMTSPHRYNDAEVNTRHCPWHHSPTACCLSFRAALALADLPARDRPDRGLHWPGSVPTPWHSAGLSELGLMEPGQWT